MFARVLVAVSAIFFSIRLVAASRVGFGDAEALYATYALFPQPAYLDHPGLIGAVGRLLAAGNAPSPWAAHVLSSLVATAVPWLGAIAAWCAGATRDRALVAAAALMAAPEITVGLFGFTPDLLLCPLWLSTLALLALAFRKPPESATSLFAFVAAGFAMGLASLAKVSGLLLPAALLLTLALVPARAHTRRAGPWLALALCALVVASLVVFEARTGFGLVHHRLVATQARAGVSLRNAGALVFGQLAYLSPVVAIAGALAAVALARTRPADAFGAFLRVSTLVSAASLGALCLWSRVAEPHWFAPAWLGMPIFVARSEVRFPIWVRRSALVTGIAFSLAVDALVLSDALPRALGSRYVARYDLANDLYAWPRALPTLRASAGALRFDDAAAIVLTPHWTIAAQAQAGLGHAARVGTVGAPFSDDFGGWLPEASWRDRRAILWVTDDRFPEARPPELAGWATAKREQVAVVRGGRVVRRVFIETLLRADTG